MASGFDGPTLHRAMTLYAEALRFHREELNSLNVYPVPDGDTGTNMLHTQEAVTAALPPEEAGFQELGEAISRSSLMGARGNSGVILSQVLRGFCRGLSALPGQPAGPQELAAALSRASEEAYGAVARPVEGTVLSVLRDAAGAARARAGDVVGEVDCDAVLEAALTEARASLGRTTEALPALRDARVVDAGGKGIVLLLDALLAAARDEEPSEAIGKLGPVGRPEENEARTNPAGTLQFEVQYLLEAEDGAISGLRTALGRLGDSLVVVGGGGLYNFHVHTNEPGEAVEAGLEAGRPRNISIVDLARQSSACLAGQARDVRAAEQTCGMVAVSEGDGLARAFASLGAVVVAGGSGDDPLVDDLVAAIEAAPDRAVLVLPNHPDVVAAAELAAGRSPKRVLVVPARSIISGIAAATAFNPTISPEENAQAMAEAVDGSRAGELARAERDASTPAGAVRSGEWLGLVDGEIVSVGREVAEVAVEVAGRVAGEDCELLTLVVGSEAPEGQARAVGAALEKAFPRWELAVLAGGQRRRPYLIGAE